MIKSAKLLAKKQNKNQLCHVLNILMEKTNTNIYQLSRNTGLANTTIARMCSDPDCNPTLSSIITLAEFFGITPNQLIGEEPLSKEHASYYPNFEQWHTVPIIRLQQTVAWPSNINDIMASSKLERVKTDLEVNRDAFAIVAEDETLEPKFSAGTILLFDPHRAPKNKDYVLLLMNEKNLPQFRQLLIDGPDTYAKIINPNFANSGPNLLVKNQFKILGILIQAKANYIK